VWPCEDSDYLAIVTDLLTGALATLLAASLRLEEAGRAVRQDMNPETVLTLTTRAASPRS
jgi:hypothetical protein